MNKLLPIWLVLALSPLFTFAQTGTIVGNVIDGKLAETLIGCSIRLDENAGGAVTDFDGNFQIQRVAVGKHKISISYPGYPSKTIEDIEVKEGEATTVSVVMEEAQATTITEVVIVAKAERSGQSYVNEIQRKSPVIADVISAEAIKRTPDRTTGDVIRRVSGASIQDGKFAVIRGLNDRYNIALLNGGLLSSTEPDRKAFSFDLFPSSMLDNLVVMKTASPDLPGEFAGGAILLNTKDIPEENFLRLNVSGGYNTVTTGKSYLSTQSGGTDALGLDDGTRAFPANFPSKTDYINSPVAEKTRSSQLFANDWGYSSNSSAAPNGSFQLSAGLVGKADRKIQPGTTFGFSYSNSNRLQNGARGDRDNDGRLFTYNDEQFQNNVLWGALWNSALKIGNKHKLVLQATYSTNTDNVFTERTGQRTRDQEDDIIATSSEYTQNHLLTTRLGGEHAFGERGIKLNWGGGYNQVSRDVPSLRRMLYSKPFDVDGEPPLPYTAFVPFGSADLGFGGRFYSKLTEDVYNANADLNIPFKLGEQKQAIKVGFLHQNKDRAFDARVMGYIRNNIILTNPLVRLPQDQIFASENVNDKAFLMNEITNPSDAYTGAANLNAGYVMFDNRIGNKLRATWGFRYETFQQKINSFDFSGAPVNPDNTTNNLLPSVNLTYSLTETQQLRFSVSQTVTRPEFREISPFSFFDFNLNAAILGAPGLKTGTINNFDIRYEIFPGQNQMFSVSAFYKDFKNPIEFSLLSAGNSRIYSYANAPTAKNFGVEAEVRKNFSFVGAGWENLVIFANGALIRSSLDLEGINAWDKDRALQGQSPYIINTGLTYNYIDKGLSATVVYNVIGDRVAQVGEVNYPDIYERHRNLLDFSVSKRLFKKGEVKLTCSDILRPNFVFYQDINKNHKFDEGVDFETQSYNFGSTFSLGFGWRF